MKVLRKGISILLAGALLVGGVATDTANAASIKLNRKSVSVKIGRTTKLKVNGTKKKAKWSSSKSSVASVSKSGVVKGKKKGSAVITAKVAGKKLRCKVRVDRKSTSSGKAKSISTDKLAKKVSVSMKRLASSVLVTIKNNNKVMLDKVRLSINLCSSSGQTVSIESTYINAIRAGKSVDRVIWMTPEKAASVDVSKSAVSKTVEYTPNSHYHDVTSKVEVTSNVSTNGSIAYTVKNNYDGSVSTLGIIYYYDSNKKLLDTDWFFLNLSKNETKFGEQNVPSTLYTYDSAMKKVFSYASYEIKTHSSAYKFKVLY